MFDVTMHVLCLLRVRAKRPLVFHAQLDRIIDEFGGNNPFWSDVMFDPLNQCQQRVMKRVFKPRDRVDIATEEGGLSWASEVPGARESGVSLDFYGDNLVANKIQAKEYTISYQGAPSTPAAQCPIPGTMNSLNHESSAIPCGRNASRTWS